MTFWPLTNSDFPTDQTFHQFHDLYTELDLHRIRSGFHGAFATGVASQQGTLTLPDTWFRPPFWDLLMLQLLRPNFSNLPCLYFDFSPRIPLGTFSILLYFSLAKYKPCEQKDNSFILWFCKLSNKVCNQLYLRNLVIVKPTAVLWAWENMKIAFGIINIPMEFLSKEISCVLALYTSKTHWISFDLLVLHPNKFIHHEHRTRHISFMYIGNYALKLIPPSFHTSHAQNTATSLPFCVIIVRMC